MKLVLLVLLISTNSYAAYLVKQLKRQDSLKIESITYLEKKVQNKIILKSIPEFLSEKDSVKTALYQEILYPDKQVPKRFLSKLLTVNKVNFWKDSEIKKIIHQGPYDNRINITILGDGYSLNEKEKFYNDVDRIVEDLFKEVTFKSYLALFNITAIFVPSNESGISDIKQKDTAFGLYRSPKGSKRGILPGKSSQIEKALNLVNYYTHYPIIIANDDFYGGLGGRYAITTRSLDSGSMVLRHELGHNFSNVGEEYDGGQVYSGANFSSTQNVSWKHWLNGELKVNDTKFLTGAYLWQDLGIKDYVTNFEFFDSEAHYFDLEISSVGWSSDFDVKVFLDGRELKLEGVFTGDRSFFKTKKVELENGTHQLKIIDNNRDGDNVLAFANGKAYPFSYDFAKDTIAAFNVFDSSQRKRGYRPTHNQCLMRNMRSKVFCPIDQENIWLRFLSVINLIDAVEKNQNEMYALKLLNLNDLKVKWYKKSLWNRKELKSLENKTLVDLKSFGKGTYIAEVIFSSNEIRKKSSELSDEVSIEVK